MSAEFMCNEAFFWVMTSEEVLMFCYLIDLGGYRIEKGDIPDKWIECSSKKISQELYISKRTQQRVLGNLEKKGYITRKQAEFPSKRFIYVHLQEALNDICDKKRKKGKSK